MPGRHGERVLIGRQPKGQIRHPVTEGQDPDVIRARLEAHMTPEKLAETVWSVEDEELR